MKYSYLAVLKKDDNSDVYTVLLPDFQGAVSEGVGVTESIIEARKLLEIYAIMHEDEGREFPPASSFRQLASTLDGSDDIIQLIEVDTDEVRSRKLTRISKTVTLPTWLNKAGQEKGINFSRLLEQALRDKLNI